MFWMSNATELLNFFQVKVEVMEKEWEFEGENDLKTTAGKKKPLRKIKSLNWHRNLAKLNTEMKADTEPGIDH